MSFTLGDEFDSYEEFLRVKEAFEQSHFVDLSKDRTSLLKRQNDPALCEKLVYSRITFACKYGTKRTPSKSKGIRRVTSFKQGCPFLLELRVKKCKMVYKLCVVKFAPAHNDHPMDEHNFRHLPKQRRLNNSIKAEIKAALKSNLSKKQLQEYIRQKTGQVVLLKDLRNLSNKMDKTDKTVKSDLSNDDIIVMIDAMKEVPGAVIQIAVTDDSELVGVYFQDHRMSVLCKSFPELMVYDASYRLVGDQLFTLLMLVVDGNGDYEVGCIWVSTSESAEAFEAFVKIFKEHNASWVSLEVLMGELDFPGRDVFKENFPGAHFSACQFHVYKNFYHEICARNFQLSEVQKESLRLSVKRLMLASSNDKYEEMYEGLRLVFGQEIFEFYTQKLHETRDAWCSYLNNNFFNQGCIGEECVNQKLRKSMSRIRFPDLKQFFLDLMSVLQSSAIERNHRFMMRLQKVPVVINNRMKEDEEMSEPMPSEYGEQLTAFAFEKVKVEFERSAEVVFEQLNEFSGCCRANEEDEVSVNATSSRCDCRFNVSMKLPCAHVMAYRKTQLLPIFEPKQIERRWSKTFCREVSESLEENRAGLDRLTNSLSNALSKVDRSTQIGKHTSQIEQCLMEMPLEQYEFYLEKLKQLASCVTEKKRCTILATGGNLEVVNWKSRDGPLKVL